MTDGMRDRVKGTMDEMKGRGESAVGDVTGDTKTKAQGEFDKLKDKADDVTDKIGGKFDRDADDGRR